MIAHSAKHNLRLLLLASCILALAVSLMPVRAAYAATSISDLGIGLLSAPRHARACQTFEATFRITNHGPDPATGLFVGISIPDALGWLDLQGAPASLAVGETATVTATIQVVAFVPGTSREAWIGAGISSDPYPNTSTDPDWSNNNAGQSLKLLGKQRQAGCW